VTAPSAKPAGSSGLLGKLMAVVRSEFRSDVLQFSREDSVFGGAECRAAGCERTARGRGLCQGHLQRWNDQGRPDLEQFAASTDPRWRRQQPNQRCRAPGCGYGSARGGMCGLHAQRWERAGRPDLHAWLAEPQPFKRPAAGATCRIPHCELWPQATSPFCQTHTNTWKVNGRPDIGEFADRFAAQTPLAGEVIQLDRLAGSLKLEMQYVLQRRHDDRQGKLTPDVVMRVVRALAAANVGSLLDHGEDAWQERTRLPVNDSCARGFLGYSCRVIADLAEAGGWEAECPRDVWRMRRLGFDGDRTLRFTGIGQPWLRELAKRWVRWRLSTGLGLEAGGGRPVVVLTRFAGFLADIGVERIEQVDRSVLERYLADLCGGSLHSQRRGVHIGLLNRFFAAIRQHRWDTALPADAAFFTEDYPKREERLPRALAEQVMAQLEDPDNLARFADPAHRLITIILMRCGLRITDALRLGSDCVVADAEGAPYLRYLNHKMKRDALVPIDEQVRGLIAEHRNHTAERWPAGTPGLFPRPTKNIDGTHPIGRPTYRMALSRWLSVCDIRDENGQPVHLTPHQWRHTLGTRLINRDVPQEVVRRILDHDSAQMTGHYARLHDTTVRRQWEAARKVDIHGTTVSFDPAGPIAEAAWAKQRLGRATQALPNGYCGLPVQQSCPHANACLTCPMFLTTGEFLPQHRQQRQQTLQLITTAEARGQQRLAEMNRQVLHNLDTIITALDDSESEKVKHAD
jgi:integrase/ferredoxin